MKRDGVRAYVQMKCDTPLPLYQSINTLDYPSIPLVTHILNGWRISQPKDK